MDTSKKINQNAGKGARYQPQGISAEFGQPNLAKPGAGISVYAKIKSQPHASSGMGGQQQSTDMSGGLMTIKAPGHSTDNFSQHPAGVSGPSRSIAGGPNPEADIPPPGDLVPGRRGSPSKGKSSEAYRGKGV